jgi:hypothetical protein
MAFYAAEIALLFCPTAIAIHNNSNVPGHTLGM